MKKFFLTFLVIISLFSLTMPVFAASSISLNERSIFFFVNNGKLGAWDRLVYDNPQGESIKVIIPNGASQIQGGTSKTDVKITKDNTKETADGLELTIQLPKGSDQLELNYVLTPNGNLFDYSTKIEYPTKLMQFQTTGQIGVSGPQVGQGSAKKSGDSNIVTFPVTSIQVGSTIQAKLDIAPDVLNPSAASTQQNQQQTQQPAAQQAQAQTQGQQGAQNVVSDPTQTGAECHSVVGLNRFWKTSAFRDINPHVFALIILFLILGFIYYIYTQKRKAKLLDKLDIEEMAFQKLYNKEKDLIIKIADLDLKYQSQQIEEEEYKNLRENYKNRAQQIKAHLLKLSE